MSEKIKTAVMEIIKAHMVGEDKNTKAVLSDVMQSVNELETLEQESTYYPPCQDCNKKMDEIRRIYDKIKEQEPCDDALIQQKSETVTEFADRCRECGARYGKLLEQKSGKCKTCKYWQDNNNGYPSDMCKWRTDETPDADDYCSEYEPQESEEV